MEESKAELGGSTARTEAPASDPFDALLAMAPLTLAQRIANWRSILHPIAEEKHYPKLVDAASASSLVSLLDAVAAELKAMNEMYTQVTAPLQECCQKYKLGLGGELCHELVIEEVERCRALLPTAAEARAMLNASTYSKSSDSGWKKLRSLRDGA